MTLDEAIKHAEEVAEEKESEAQDLEYSKLDWRHEANQCSKCAEEHRQLAEWLKELKQLREQESCEEQEIYEKAYKEGYDKGWSDGNFIGKNRWTPVSERLPEKNGEYLITGRQGAVNKRRYHDGHWYGNWSVLAWMPLPQPYKESEE